MSAEQLSLDDYGPARQPARARRGDNAASHRAADELERSGRAEKQKLSVLRGIAARPGATTKELAAFAGLDRHLVGRRMPELVAQGYVERWESKDGFRHRMTTRGWDALEQLEGAR